MTLVQLATLFGASVKKFYQPKIAGKSLSTNDFTDTLKNKLAALDENHFKGTHLTKAALDAANPAGIAGDYADVDSGAGNDVVRYIYDINDNKWVKQSGSVAGETAASIKTKYESNPETNALSDADLAKLGNVPSNTITELAGKEPKITKKTAFNKNFGTAPGDVMAGDTDVVTGTITQAQSDTAFDPA